MNKTDKSFDTIEKVVAEIDQLANNSLDLEDFIKKVVFFIHLHFNLFSANLYLIEDSGEWAILRAGTGATSQAALERGHKLATTGLSMVGKAIRAGESMVAADILQEEQEKRFWSAVPPPIHSELVIPLKTRAATIIGAIDVQSSEYEAFDVAEIKIFQEMATEIAGILSGYSRGKVT